jgi:hypothetical protein
MMLCNSCGKITLEQKVATTPETMKQTFGKIPRSLIALETGLGIEFMIIVFEQAVNPASLFLPNIRAPTIIATESGF